MTPKPFPELDLETPGAVVALHILAAIVKKYRDEVDCQQRDKLGVIFESGRPVPSLFIERVSGGVEGNCSRDYLTEIEVEPPSKPRAVFDFLKLVAPETSFISYDNILSAYQTTSRVKDGFYGSRTEYESLYLPLSVFLKKLQKHRVDVLDAYEVMSARGQIKYSQPAIGLDDFTCIVRNALGELKARKHEDWNQSRKSPPSAEIQAWNNAEWVDRTSTETDAIAFLKGRITGILFPTDKVSEMPLGDLFCEILKKAQPTRDYSVDGVSAFAKPMNTVQSSKCGDIKQDYLDLQTLYVAFLGRDWVPAPTLEF
ncbi:hypothetical protein [Acetobacter persici]|uniref:Uncharacterized protein n=1 Tax=Acetobacter persici TaxID=1076596 RepID=A0A1U9LJ98_9PROT|nr:hypothetical protein [Acetobacter persici]AQT06534.1 hypothetical protein A0U91_16130 [Acetobacter persici]